jgi:hypothetical protein
VVRKSIFGSLVAVCGVCGIAKPNPRASISTGQKDNRRSYSNDLRGVPIRLSSMKLELFVFLLDKQDTINAQEVSWVKFMSGHYPLWPFQRQARAPDRNS